MKGRLRVSIDVGKVGGLDPHSPPLPLIRPWCPVVVGLAGLRIRHGASRIRGRAAWARMQGGPSI